MIQCMHENVWETKDIEFIAEGGASVVFGNNSCKCCVLKLQKLTCFDDINLVDLQEQISKSNTSDLEFITANFMSQEHISVHIPQSVTVTTIANEFLLHLNTLWNDNRPASRQREDKGITILSSTGIFEENVFYHPHKGIADGIQTIHFSMEIKVKSCFPSISPFIHNINSFIKHIKTRYEIMQLYKEQKRRKLHDSNTPWGVFHEISQYRPADLCSGKFSSVYRAVRSLFVNPQNNLKVYLEDKHIYGWSLDSSHLLHLLTSRVFSELDSEEIRLNSLMIIVSNELTSSFSNAFHQLAEIQQLDLIDSEGAQLLYLHLQTFFMGQSDCDKEFLTYLKAPCNEAFEKFSSLVRLLYEDTDSTSFDLALQAAEGVLSFGTISLLHLIYDFHSCLSSSTVTIEQKQWYCLKARGLVTCLFCKMDCFLFLKAWMLSTIACDASVVMRLSLNPLGKVLSSRLSVIDLGIKSFSKLTTKADKDTTICNIIQGT